MRKRSIFSDPIKSAKATFISDFGGDKKNKISVTGFSLIKTISLLSLGALLHSTLSSIFRSAGVSPIEPKNANSESQEQVLSPFFSIKPLTKSLHPKYKLWTEMNEKEKDEAVKMAQKIMSKYALKIAPKDKTLNQWRSIKHGTCEFEPSVGRNGHTLCGPKLQPPCNFISFGINDDPSFDRDLGDWGCLGFAGDPTVHHPSKLHEKVTFHNIGATMLQDNEERQVNKGGQEEWWMTSFPKLRYFLGLDKIDILKIDCEGCEVALSRDMLREDPYFLSHVDQISIETHVTRAWMTTREHVYYFGLLLILLEEAGFVMEWSSIFGCSKRHEDPVGALMRLLNLVGLVGTNRGQVTRTLSEEGLAKSIPGRDMTKTINYVPKTLHFFIMKFYFIFLKICYYGTPPTSFFQNQSSKPFMPRKANEGTTNGDLCIKTSMTLRNLT